MREHVECPTCNGEGVIVETISESRGQGTSSGGTAQFTSSSETTTRTVECPTCDGHGSVESDDDPSND